MHRRRSCPAVGCRLGWISLQHADTAISGRTRRETGHPTAAPSLREAGDLENIFNQGPLKTVICRKQFASHRNGRRVQPHPDCRQILPSLFSQFHEIFYHQGFSRNN